MQKSDKTILYKKKKSSWKKLRMSSRKPIIYSEKTMYYDFIRSNTLCIA